MTVPAPPGPRPADPRVRAEQLRAAVDDAMAGLDGLAGQPLAEHVTAFERVHTALSAALAGPGGG